MRYEDTDAIGWCDWNTYRNWHRVTLDCPIAILLTCESGKLYFACINDTLVSPFCLQFFATDVCIKILDESVTLAKAVTHYWPSSCSHSESKSFWLISHMSCFAWVQAGICTSFVIVPIHKWLCRCGDPPHWWSTGGLPFSRGLQGAEEEVCKTHRDVLCGPLLFCLIAPIKAPRPTRLVM